MDIARQFRCLVRDHFISDHSICDQYFTFQTVFFTLGSSYCCCRCAYDHEYFTYISDTGDIDTEKFDMLAKAVESGHCEHTTKVENEKHLKQTKVYSIHVAAALGLEDMVEAITTHLDTKEPPLQDPDLNVYGTKLEYRIFKRSGLFHLTPCDIGVLKHNGNILHLVDTFDPNKRIPRATESVNNTLYIEETSLVDICIQENNTTILQALSDDVKPTRIINSIIVFESLFMLNLKDELKTILDDKIKRRRRGTPTENLHDPCVTRYLDDLHINRRKDIVSIGELAVVYHQRDLFEKSMNAVLDTNFNQGYSKLAEACIAFERVECEEALKTTEMSDTSKLECLFRFLVKYTLSRDHIKKAMMQIPDLPNIINDRRRDGMTLLQSYIVWSPTVKIYVVRTLIDFGANIDISLTCTPETYSFFKNEREKSRHQTLLIHIFNSKLKHIEDFRKVVELFLYENVSLVANSTAISTAIKHCRNGPGKMPQPDPSNQTGTYIMDAILHEDVFTSTIPLLIEAGFQYDLSDIEDAMELFKDTSLIANSMTSSEDSVLHVRTPPPKKKKKNHEQSMPQNPVKAYLQRCLSEPRPLMLQCRDVLRTHFPRRQIHRYVAVMDIPNRIRDFLLLKPILQKLSVDIKSESYNRYGQIRKRLSGYRNESTRKPLSDNRDESMSEAEQDQHELIKEPSSDNRYESTRKSSSFSQYR